MPAPVPTPAPSSPPGPEGRSVLTPWQRPLVRLLVVGAVAVAATGLFLWGTPGGSPSATGAFVAHVLAGAVLTLVLLAFAVPHAVAQTRRKPGIALTGALVLFAALACVVSGAWMIVSPGNGARGSAWTLHVATGLAIFALYAVHRRFGSNPARWGALAAGFASVVLLAGGFLVWERVDPGHVSAFEAADAEAAEAARDRFFPSSVTTGAGELLLTAEEIRDVAACARCHRQITQEWKRSAHRHASMTNPFYRASIEDLRKRYADSKTDTRWCAGCHDPALLFVKDPKSGLAKIAAPDLDFDSEDARVGLTCVVCHASEPRSTNGNSDFVLRGRKVYPGEKDGGIVAKAHDVLLRLKARAHVESLSPKNVREAAFCSLCHKAEPPPELNRWKWIRAQDEYDAHDDSGVSMGSSRSFYHPPAAKRCQDCHMPLVPDPDDPAADADGMVRSHLFAAANTALAHMRGDADMIRKIEKFLGTACRVDVTAVVLPGERRFAPAWVAKPAVAPGEVIEAQVVVRNLGVGHRFPGGTVDSNEVWLEFEASVGEDAAFYASGRVDPETLAVDPSAEFYRSFWLMRDGSRFVTRVASDLYTPIYVRRIGPGSADVVRYRFRVPPEAKGTLSMKARLRYRKFMLPFMERVAKTLGGKGLVIPHRLEDETNLYALGKAVQVDLGKLPIVEMATGALVLPITPEGTKGPPPAAETLPLTLPEDRDRLNDLAIAHLVQGDPERAAAGFSEVTRVDPKYADGWVNVARAMIDLVRFDEAKAAVDRATALVPDYPKALFFEAEIWRAAWRDFRRAEELYRRVLSKFPRDRMAWKRLGEVLYMQERPKDALAVLDEYMRKIESEDTDAWFWVMRARQDLGDVEGAEQARAAHDRFRRDDEQTNRQGETLLEDRNIHRLAQPIHAHEQAGLRSDG